MKRLSILSTRFVVYTFGKPSLDELIDFQFYQLDSGKWVNQDKFNTITSTFQFYQLDSAVR